MYIYFIVIVGSILPGHFIEIKLPLSKQPCRDNGDQGIFEEFYRKTS